MSQTSQQNTERSTEPSSPSATVCIVGAGSMGIFMGADLHRAGVEVTFLVRPHRRDQLARPQALYSWDEHTLEQYSDYTVITDPTALSQTPFDFVVVTLDGAALRNEAGTTLVKEIGRAYRDTTTGVILGAIGLQVLPWFLQTSGLSADQVAMGSIAEALVYEAQAATVPVGPGNADLLAQADYAYRHLSPVSFTIDDSAPQMSQAYAALYDAPGVLPAKVVPAAGFALRPAGAPVLFALDLMGSPAMQDVDPADPLWQLGVESVREVQRLSIFGEAGQAAAAQTDPAALLAGFQRTAQVTEPLDFNAFNAYHHGGKVNRQNRELLAQALQLGEADGAQMPATRALLDQLPAA